ncbi:lysylphosphatidylglycerol synthase transmembrane domain-containing protein [Alloscardovia criceti]|uniref:lysylphosphatidylglycerol synthase transmembrane domain-containing protein n=1 Tax=Alloscardovia criceti TaxID=356828 RepID=UPI000375C6BA|nr:lysylphosphatidylglycerol synthase transmembrane domain-containing protein [Alloscardovia criceti]
MSTLPVDPASEDNSTQNQPSAENMHNAAKNRSNFQAGSSAESSYAVSASAIAEDPNSINTAEPPVVISDAQPQRAHDFSDLAGAVLTLIIAVVLTLISLYLRGVTRGVEADAHTVGNVLNDWLFALPLTFLQQATMVVITFSVVIQLLMRREWAQTVISILGFMGGIAIAIIVSQIITSTHYAPLVDALSSPSTVQFLLPELFSGLAAFLTCAGPKRLRSTLVWSWNILLVVAAILIMVSANSFVGMTVSLLLGRTIGLIMRYLFGSPNVGMWAEDIVQSAKSVGLEPASIVYSGNTTARLSHFSVDDDLALNSRRYLLTTRSGEHFTVRVADSQRHSENYLRQLWQTVQLSGLSLRRDRSVVDITHHHMLMLLAVRDAGLDAVAPFAAANNNDSAVLFIRENTTITPAQLDSITPQDAAQVLRSLEKAHLRGITHRNISAHCLARNAQGELIVCGWENGDIASSSSHIAADRVQMLTLLSALLGMPIAVKAAQEVWDTDTLFSIAPYVQNVLIPASVKDLEGWDKNLTKDLRTALVAASEQEDTDDVELVTLSRFNLRSFISAFLVVIALSVILTQLNPRTVIHSVSTANPLFALLSLLAGCASWIGSALILGTYMDKDKRNYVGIFVSQIAQSFASVSMPAGIGPAFVNLRFLRKTGHKNTAATAAMSAVVAVQFVVTFLVMVVLGLFTGNNGISGLLPTGTLAIVLGMLILLIALSMLITPVRALIMNKLVPMIKNFARQLILLLTQPGKLAVASAGAIIQSLMLSLSFWAALRAFNMPAGYIETSFIFLVANTIGSAAPTPGGLGGVETSLTVAFSGVGIPSAVALSATLLYRVMTYWIRIPMGAVAMSWMSKKNLI